jgi:hypothetical protein
MSPGPIHHATAGARDSAEASASRFAPPYSRQPLLRLRLLCRVQGVVLLRLLCRCMGVCLNRGPRQPLLTGRQVKSAEGGSGSGMDSRDTSATPPASRVSQAASRLRGWQEIGEVGRCDMGGGVIGEV